MHVTSALVAELTVVRHGERIANAAFRVAARDAVDAGVPGPDSAVGLSALGREQAAALDHPDRRALVIAHDSVVLMSRQVIEDLTAEDLAAVVARGPVLNAAVTRFTRRADRLVLAEYNTPVRPARAPAAPSG